MAEVVNDANESIKDTTSQSEKKNDAIKLNGDTSEVADDETNANDHSEDDIIVPQKHVNEVSNKEKLLDQSVSDKPNNLIANGYIEKDAEPVEDDSVLNDEAENSLNAPSNNRKRSNSSSSSTENGRICEQLAASGITISSTAVSNKSGDVLNLSKLSKNDTSGSSMCDMFKTSSGLSITVVSSKPTNGDSVDAKNLSIDDKPDDGSGSEKNMKYKKSPSITITPRRSSRNLNKQKNYSDKNDTDTYVDEDDIEEVTLVDPLADDSKLRSRNKQAIIVSDTKGLVEFASNAKPAKGNKREPTLVIIDTKSILSGRGPVPVSKSSSNNQTQGGSGSAPIAVTLPMNNRSAPSSNSAFSVIPLGVHSQAYSSYKTPPLPQMKPIVVGPPSTSVSSVTIQPVSAHNAAPPAQPKPQVLPSLTDDMFVVEAPSFIVPYVYEKPPVEALKEQIEKLKIEVDKDKIVMEIEKEELDRDETEKEEEEKSEKSENTEKSDAEDKEKKDAETSDEKMEVVEEDLSKTSKEDKVDEAVKKGEEDKKVSTSIKDDKKVAPIVSYFDNPLGKFFSSIGLNLVQEHVQTDLLRSQRRKRDREGENCSADVLATIDELTKTLESSKENNDPFKLNLRKCELCSFKTESTLVMAHHLETPHMKNFTYRCNFCPSELRSPHDILFHMESEHNVRGRLERAPAFHQCPSCPFEDNQKGKLTRHLVSCAKKYRPERNQEPPLDWEPPAKIPRVTRNRPPSMNQSNAVYQAAMCGLKQGPQNSLLPKLMPNASNMKQNLMNVNKRSNTSAYNRFPSAIQQATFLQRLHNQGVSYRAPNNSQTQMLLPQAFQFSASNTSIYPSQNAKQMSQVGAAASKLLNQPSISITPLPRQTSSQPQLFSGNTTSNVKPGRPIANKHSLVACEICDSYIKDLEQLRNHMQWIHKVKIHPKMIYNRPPLNCQKCQYRFFTDQGLERHLLGSHGLVTSSMQEAANKEKDGGRCPICGRVYQWKLLNHVSRDHQLTLKPAHLSYKCTVCTATFGMYKQFESHVYSAHSVVARRAMEPRRPPVPPTLPPPSQNDALLHPLKINDEITIIPQPMRSSRQMPRMPPGTSIAVTSKSKIDDECKYGNDHCRPSHSNVVEALQTHSMAEDLNRCDRIDSILREKFSVEMPTVRLLNLVHLRPQSAYKVDNCGEAKEPMSDSVVEGECEWEPTVFIDESKTKLSASWNEQRQARQSGIDGINQSTMARADENVNFSAGYWDFLKEMAEEVDVGNPILYNFGVKFLHFQRSKRKKTIVKSMRKKKFVKSMKKNDVYAEHINRSPANYKIMKKTKASFDSRPWKPLQISSIENIEMSESEVIIISEDDDDVV